MKRLDRYIRQIVLPQIGKSNQQRLLKSSALIIGCGALGSIIAQSLARSGVGKLTLIDRDIVDLNNLHRQILFDEQDAKNALPKAEAAARKLKLINSQIDIRGMVMDINPFNIEDLIFNADIILDGTDNFETRYIINDACIKQKKPWIYGGVVGTYGMTMNIIPSETPCLRCIFPNPPEPGTFPTCETSGIINTIPFIIGSLQATEAIKILIKDKMISRKLISFDVWTTEFKGMEVKSDENCPLCAQAKFEFLKINEYSSAIRLCGRQSIQINPGREAKISLRRLKEKLKPLGKVESNDYLLRFSIDKYEMVIFPDGRAIIKGTDDQRLARNLYSKYIGI